MQSQDECCERSRGLTRKRTNVHACKGGQSEAKDRVRVRGAVRKGLQRVEESQGEAEEEVKSQELPEATAGAWVCEGRRARKSEHLPAEERK